VRKSLLFAAVLLAITALSGRAQASGHVYLLRGLAGIFSTGLNVLDEKLLQRDYNATVHPYDFYNSLAEEAARLQKSGKGPIIMGHSLGADAAIYMAEKMKTLGAPVALVVTFVPTTAVKCGPSRQLLHGQHFGIKRGWVQRFHFQHQPQFRRRHQSSEY
jgi:hypothetical protein